MPFDNWFRPLQSLASVLLLVLTLLVSITLPVLSRAESAVAATEEIRHQVTQQDDWVKNPDGLRLYGQYWMPADGTVRSVIVIVHGTVEHSGLYEPVARLWASRGHVVYGTDLQGWGRSEGEGARGYVKSHDKYVRDLARLEKRLRARYPDRKLIMVGESLGACVELLGALREDLTPDALMFSGPAFKPGPTIGGFGTPRFLDRIALWAGSMFGTVFPNWPTVPSNVGIRVGVENPALRERMLKDPYVSHNWLPAIYLTALEKADEVNRQNVGNLRLPLFIAHGERDMLVPLESSEELFRRVGSTNKVRKVYLDTPHATLIELGNLKVAMDMITWAEKLL